MKSKLILLTIIFSLFGCKKSSEQSEKINEVEQTDSLVKVESSLKEEVKKGTKAPDFLIKSIDGKEYNLQKIKGKYVYIDVWATWCGPCKVQIPYMKQLEEKFRDAPIEFVSISVDDEKDKSLWKKMVEENEMSGLQLFAGRENNFAYDYQIQFIPTFILLDKEGNILLRNAPEPMDFEKREVNQKLVDILSKLK